MITFFYYKHSLLTTHSDTRAVAVTAISSLIDQ